MKILKCFFTFAAIALCLGFSSCSNDDDGPSYSETSIVNARLKAILTGKGYTFDGNGNLLLDDKAVNTTSLDLSDTKVDTAALKELSVFPNLKELNLSHNGYGPGFNFALLPSKINSVDLSNNKIFEYPGLVNIVTAENGDETVTVQRNLSKLVLPQSAQYNCVEIPTYFAHKDASAEVEMQDSLGNVKAYTTLRDVPCEATRAYLKDVFPSLFVGNQIDVSKRLVKLTEANASIDLERGSIPKSSSTKNITSVEGVEYVAMNPGFQGATIYIDLKKKCTLAYLKTNRKLGVLSLSNINTPLLDVSNSNKLCYILLEKNDSIRSLNLSHCTLMGTRSMLQETSIDLPSGILVLDCPSFEKISISKAVKNLGSLSLEELPNLKKLDLSMLSYIQECYITEIPNCNVTMYNFSKPSDWTVQPFFDISEDVYKQSSVKEFLDKYHSNLKSSGWTEYGKTYDWTVNYK